MEGNGENMVKVHETLEFTYIYEPLTMCGEHRLVKILSDLIK